MLPEVAAFFAAKDEANAEHAKNLDKVRTDYPRLPYRYGMSEVEYGAYLAAGRAQDEAENLAYTARDEAIRAAKAKLVHSDNPIVRFIATSVEGSYTDEAETVLRALPLSREQLQSFGKDQGWCDKWDDYLALAEEAGVLGETEWSKLGLDISALVNALWEEGCSKPTARRLLHDYLPGIIANANAKS